MSYTPLYLFRKGIKGYKSFLVSWASVLIDLIVDTPNARSRGLCIAFSRSPDLSKFELPSLSKPCTSAFMIYSYNLMENARAIKNSSVFCLGVHRGGSHYFYHFQANAPCSSMPRFSRPHPDVHNAVSSGKSRDRDILEFPAE